MNEYAEWYRDWKQMFDDTIVEDCDQSESDFFDEENSTDNLFADEEYSEEGMDIFGEHYADDDEEEYFEDDD